MISALFCSRKSFCIHVAVCVLLNAIISTLMNVVVRDLQLSRAVSATQTVVADRLYLIAS